MTSETRSALYFPVHSRRLSVVRDVAIFAVCIAIAASFVVDLWRSAPSEPLRAAAPAGQVTPRA